MRAALLCLRNRYNGIDAKDPAILDVVENLAAHFYTQSYSQSSLVEYVEAGWRVVDISWVPLYIAHPIYTPQQVFEYFNLFWASRANGVCWTGSSGNLTNNCEMYWRKGREAQTLGAIMSTWTAKQPDEMGLVRGRAAALAEHSWSYRPFPYPQAGPGSFAEFQPRSAAADTMLDKLIGEVPRAYKCDPQSLQCVPMPRYANGSSWTNGTDYESDCGGPCCGRPCPGPPAGTVYGGRLWATKASSNTSMGGIAGADALCAADAVANGLIPAGSPAAEMQRYRALLADEAGCGGKPCRRATITPGVGDGQVDWVIAPNAAYYKLDNKTLVTWSNSSRMLGMANHTKIGHDNQLAPFGLGWETLPNRTCDSWRWSVGMPGGPFGSSVGSQGWEPQPFTATAGEPPNDPLHCVSGDFVCVEMASPPPLLGRIKTTDVLAAVEVHIAPAWNGGRARVAADDLLLGELRRKGVRDWRLATSSNASGSCLHLLRATSAGAVGLACGFEVGTGEDPSDEAFAVCRRNSSVILEAHTELGLMMGAGRLLREITATPNGSAVLPATLRLRVSPPPWAAMRGHQLTDWGFFFTDAAFEQFVKSLIVFGTNQIEFAHINYGRGDDDTLLRFSRIIDKYGIHLSLFMPPWPSNTSLRLFRTMARLDSVLFEGGGGPVAGDTRDDVGMVTAEPIMKLRGEIAAAVRKHHPACTVYWSPGGESKAWMDSWYAALGTEEVSSWLTGPSWGPVTLGSETQMLARIPAHYKVRLYPDICHTLTAQYPVPDWSFVWANSKTVMLF